MEFPEPVDPAESRAEVLLRYLDFFRERVIEKATELPEAELRGSGLPSGWAPVELIKHLAFVELRWIEWRFEGRSFDDPWGDERDGRWHVDPTESGSDLVAACARRAGARAALSSPPTWTSSVDPAPGGRARPRLPWSAFFST